MICNKPSISEPRTDLLRSAIEHRATWMWLLIDEAKKCGIGNEFAHKAIWRCGVFHSKAKFPQTDDLRIFAEQFANQDVVKAFEMEVLENDGERLSIDFHYCPMIAAWKKCGVPDEELPELCAIAMDGDRGIVSAYSSFLFELGKTIAKGDEACQIRFRKINGDKSV